MRIHLSWCVPSPVSESQLHASAPAVIWELSVHEDSYIDEGDDLLDGGCGRDTCIQGSGTNTLVNCEAF
jgi:hypothetical protein